MNQLAVETSNEQVQRELSTAQCQMNDTADSDGDLDDMKVTGPKNDYGGGGYGSNKVDADITAANKAIGGGEMGAAADGGLPKSFDDDTQLIAVSTLNEDTCPGKEQPLVDRAPDAAQNSDRVLWESTKSAAAVPASLCLSSLPVLATVFAMIVRSRRS